MKLFARALIVQPDDQTKRLSSPSSSMLSSTCLRQHAVDNMPLAICLPQHVMPAAGLAGVGCYFFSHTQALTTRRLCHTPLTPSRRRGDYCWRYIVSSLQKPPKANINERSNCRPKSAVPETTTFSLDEAEI